MGDMLLPRFFSFSPPLFFRPLNISPQPVSVCGCEGGRDKRAGGRPNPSGILGRSLPKGEGGRRGTRDCFRQIFPHTLSFRCCALLSSLSALRRSGFRKRMFSSCSPLPLLSRSAVLLTLLRGGPRGRGREGRRNWELKCFLSELLGRACLELRRKFFFCLAENKFTKEGENRWSVHRSSAAST